MNNLTPLPLLLPTYHHFQEPYVVTILINNPTSTPLLLLRASAIAKEYKERRDEMMAITRKAMQQYGVDI